MNLVYSLLPRLYRQIRTAEFLDLAAQFFDDSSVSPTGRQSMDAVLNEESWAASFDVYSDSDVSDGTGLLKTSGLIKCDSEVFSLKRDLNT